MRVTIRWDSTYRYSEPVRLLHTELRVLPAHAFGQERLAGEIALTPAARPIELRDLFGNAYHHVDFLDEVDHVGVGFTAEVETAEVPPDEAPPSPLLRHLYLASTARAPFDATIAAVGASVPEGLGALATAEAVCDVIHRGFVFEVGTTDVTSTAHDLIEAGRGVCQDFTHLALALLRMRGFAARYVSGYLAPAIGQDDSEASHAWIQVLDGDVWHGLDAANDTTQDGRYVVTAVGRDYDDVPPLRGTFAGLAMEDWSTTLRISASNTQQ